MAGPVMRKKDLDTLYGHVCSRCGGHQAPVNNAVSDDMQREAERIAKGLYNGTITAGTIDPAMTKLVAEELRKAVIEGFGKDLPKINFGTPDYKMLASLELNVFHFSAAENYQMLKSMSLALRDENGSIRSFKDFKEEAGKVAGVYLGRNLRTEYDTAIGSGQMAGKWVEFEKNKAVAPWLRYDTVGDSKVRLTHKKLEGVTKKVDDAFWNMYYPPNGWNCRCDVTQLLHGTETSSDQIQLPDDVPPIFQTNMAKDGLVFPDNHPYYVGLPENLKARAAALRTNQYSQAYPAKGKTKAGGKVEISNKADKADLQNNFENAQILADAGEHVRIRPHSLDKNVKNPEYDFYNGTHTGDVKNDPLRTSTEKFIRNSIDSANKQKANIPVIVLKKDRYDKKQVWQALRGELLETKRKKNITEVWLIVDGKFAKITREQIKLGEDQVLP